MDKLKGWRTIGVNVVVLLAAITDYLTHDGVPVLRSLFDSPESAAATVAAVNAVNIGLRILTTTPVGKSAPDEKVLK
jgi:hypothetical protein